MDSKASDAVSDDKISIRKGIDAVSGDKIVTVKSITKDNSAKRVYNLEIESLDGENTHNYFIGEDELWVHNVHGNNLNSKAPNVLYRLFCNGEFKKWGISKNLGRRYTKKWLNEMGCEDPKKFDEFPDRRSCREAEKYHIGRKRGPWNFRI